ncbi:choice-of-anchor Q domain-containing protein, partial [Larkinella harenae]
RANTPVNAPVWLVNNTIVSSGQDGIRLYNETQVNTLINNAIVMVRDSNYITTLDHHVRINQENNYTAASLAQAKFTNPADGDFRLGTGSPLIDSGVNTGSFGVLTDLVDEPRPKGKSYDIGAFEEGSPLPKNWYERQTLLEPSAEVTLKMYPSPTPDQLLVTLSNGEPIRRWVLVNGTGQIMLENTPAQPTKELTVFTKPLHPGIYWLRVIAGSRQYVGRFVR